MGSFNGACCLSGLPISYRDPVRFLLLRKAPASNRWAEEQWLPRTLPLRARYNDYGSVTEAEDGPARDVWMEALRTDLVERGTGNNFYRDMPLRKKDLTFEKLLDALWEERVVVRRDPLHRPLEGLPGRKLHPAIPTVRRVRRAIIKSGREVVDSPVDGPGFMVDLQRRWRVRVRHTENGAVDILTELGSAALVRWATVVTLNPDDPEMPELLVAPHPFEIRGTEYNVTRLPDDPGTMPITQAMVREDVWQDLISLSTTSWLNDAPFHLAEFRRLAEKVYQAFLEPLPDDPEKARIHEIMRELSYGKDNPVGQFLKGESPLDSTVSPLTHVRLMAARRPADDVLEPFLDTMAEFALVRALMVQTRRHWRPSHTLGQDWRWPDHTEVLRCFYETSHRLWGEHAARERAEREKDEERMRLAREKKPCPP